MLKEYKKQTNTYGGIGYGLIVIATLLATLSNDKTPLILIVLYVLGRGLFIWGCIGYSKGKGYHGKWGALGMFGIFGAVILACFPDKLKDGVSVEPQAQPPVPRKKIYKPRASQANYRPKQISAHSTQLDEG